MKHRIRMQHESEMWPAYLRLCEELTKLGKSISRVRVDIAVWRASAVRARHGVD